MALPAVLRKLAEQRVKSLLRDAVTGDERSREDEIREQRQRASTLFQRLELEAFKAGITPRTEQSREWFRKRAQRLTRVDRKALMMEDEIQRSTKTVVGNMYMFFYDPKTKDKLPYYDKFPLIFVIGPAKDGFYGLNLHYLPPTLRLKFLSELLQHLTNDKYDEQTKVDLTYKMLNATARLKAFKPCFKHYLTKHVKGQFAMVPAPEWEIATFLPIAQWEKAKANKVYSDSRKMI